jgi:predicted DNA-binding transcriptional regulator YafY
MPLQNIQGKRKDKPKNQLTQLDRQLLIYEIFYFSEEISYKEITDRIPTLGVRMIQRDVADLQAAGLIYVKYDRDANAYVHVKKREDVQEKPKEYSEKKKKHLEQP